MAVFTAFFTLLPAHSAHAAEFQGESDAKALILMEAETGTVLYEKNADQALPPASVTKVMSMLLVMEAVDSGKITLDDMAAEASMSTKYFCSFFKKMTHKSPVEYLITYRIERACRKLIGTDKSVTDIAYECGFNDLSYFIKTFKEQKGVTPGAFRNM